MAWQGIQGHDAVVQRFRRAQERGRLAGSFLFVGSAGIGKRLFAFGLAKGILCKGREETSLDPCGRCESCRLFGEKLPETASAEGDANRSFVSPHPDLYYVAKPATKSDLPIDLLIGDKEHRGHAGLCYEISRTPFLGHCKVAVIDDADFLNAEGANALLKTLEEPPPDSVLILIGTSATKQLPTIRSRCQIIRFAPLSPRVLASILVEREIVSTLEQGLALAKRAGGSLDQARELFDDTVDEMRGELGRFLAQRRIDAVSTASTLNEFVEKAGKEAYRRRQRLRLLLNLAVDFFRDRIRKLETSSPDGETVEVHERHLGEAQLSARRLERTLDALDQVDRNANLSFVVDAWCSDLNADR